MRQMLATTYRLIALVLTLLLVLLQARLYWPPMQAYAPPQVGPDVVDQLRYLRTALDQGAGEEMQALFPEGYFFSHGLYGLAWVDLGMRVSPDSTLHAQARTESRRALAALDSPAGRAVFSPTLDPPYGVFYLGWSSWLRGGVLRLDAPAQREPALVAQFAQDCAALRSAFERSPTPFLQAYPGQAWPVDSVVGMAAVRLCDAVLEQDSSLLVQRWLAEVQQRLDPATGLIPHRVDPRDGMPLEGARGSSQSIIARFLPEIDQEWGLIQYRSFRQQFVTTVAGVPGVREYPLGRSGTGDVDSGPLIAGISLSASAVTLGAARAIGDTSLTDGLHHTGEWLGMGLTWRGEKRYAFGMMPVGDAFFVWAKTAQPWLYLPKPGQYEAIQPWWWRVPIHLLGLMMLCLLWLPVLRPRQHAVPE